MRHNGKAVLVSFRNKDLRLAGDTRNVVLYPVERQEHLAALMAQAGYRDEAPTADELLAMQPDNDAAISQPMLGTSAVISAITQEMLAGTRTSMLQLTWKERQVILGILEKVEEEDGDDEAFDVVDALDLIDKVRWCDLGDGWTVDLGSYDVQVKA